MILQISAGRGPAECQLAVFKFYEKLKSKYADIELITSESGSYKNCFESICFKTDADLSGYEGTVLWICKSPFRKNHKRKNWFIGVNIIPEENAEILSENKEGDFKIETFRSGGNGGQNVNKVETGVRVTHIPTGLNSRCTSDRSQAQNKRRAFEMLKQKLKELDKDAKERHKTQAWQHHNVLERGNPVHIFEGMDFKLKK